MELFLDSAGLADINEAFEHGVVTGVTTNPSLMSKEPKSSYMDHIGRVVERVWASNPSYPVSVEVVSHTPGGMLSEAIHIAEVFRHGNVVVKIPMDWEYTWVMKGLKDLHVRINCTCVFSTAQALLAASAGVDYVSFFYNRMKDRNLSPRQSISSTREAIDKGGLGTRIICGSIRSAGDVVDCFDMGAHIVTCSLSILKSMAYHEGTEASVRQFLSDFSRWAS